MSAEPVPSALKRGQTFEERFRITQKAGSGRWGTVYGATRVSDGDKVALRIFDPQRVGDPTRFLSKLAEETNKRMRLCSPHTLRVLEYGCSRQGHFFMVMEWARGQALAHLLATRGPVRSSQALQVCQRVCMALEDAHAHGVIHGQLSPALLRIEGRALSAIRVLGFGDPQLRGMSDLAPWTAQHVRYAAPERLAGDRLSRATDVYGVGLLLYELLSGRPAFDHDSPVRVLLCQRQGSPRLPRLQTEPELSQTVAEVLEGCLDPNPEARFQTVGELSRALKHLQKAGLAA